MFCCFLISKRKGGGWFFFFFQAEDGIRDADVTGVQTCALPIWGRDQPGGNRAPPAPGPAPQPARRPLRPSRRLPDRKRRPDPRRQVRPARRRPLAGRRAAHPGPPGTVSERARTSERPALTRLREVRRVSATSPATAS